MLLATTPLAAMGRSVPSLFTDAGPFAKVILLLLFVISVISWAIVWDRTRLYLRLRARGEALRRALEKDGIGDVSGRIDAYMPSIEGAILMEARDYVAARPGRARAGRIVARSPAGEEIERAKLREALERRAIEGISSMERHLIFLSTTSGVAPFLGLLGTGWGIMSSFLSMGVQGTASIEVVGPGIAEALVTTIAGLAAAIPALVGYNLLVRNVHRKEAVVDLFISRIIQAHVTSGVGTEVVPSAPDATGSRAGV